MILAKRYVDGFLEYARGAIGFEEALEELKNAKDVFRDNPEFLKFLGKPVITYNEKCGVIDEVFAKSFSQDLRNFLKLLLKKDRVEIFFQIADYARIKYAHGEKVEAVLSTSYMLDTDLVRSIKDAMERKMNKKLQLYVKLDPDLLGGVKVDVGNKVIDGSVKKRLEEIKEKMTALRMS
ncbi:MAG: ATP synthase F1 subunit delta [Candidatus Omnitrophota bacterium]|nr:ATP synthase F1 subunit delta [Candidatus Omnitrophota bacterium]